MTNSNPSEAAKRVLIVRTGAMGDVLHALPAVAALRLLHPNWHIDWAIEPAWWQLLVSHRQVVHGDTTHPETIGPGPLIDTAIAVQTRLWKHLGPSLKTLRLILALRRRLRAGRYDLCVDLQGSLRSAIIGRMAGATRFLGPASPRETPARLLYSEPIPTPAPHVIDQACQLLAAALGHPLTPIPPTLPTDPIAKTATDSFIRLSLDPAPKPRIIVLAPTAGWPAKQWPVPHFAELARRLAATGLFVLVNAPTGGSPEASEIARIAGDRVAPHPCTLAELTALLRRTSLFIGGDTGPLHLADALDVPVVALFGPTDPARTGPRGPHARILRHPTSVTDHRRHPHTEPGLARITVEDVLQAALALLAETENPAG